MTEIDATILCVMLSAVSLLLAAAIGCAARPSRDRGDDGCGFRGVRR